MAAGVTESVTPAPKMSPDLLLIELGLNWSILVYWMDFGTVFYAAQLYYWSDELGIPGLDFH